MERRAFLLAAASGVLAVPLAAGAQQGGLYRIGYLPIAAEEHITIC